MFYNKEIFKDIFFYKGIYWYKNIFQIPKYFKCLNFLVKHGYNMYAAWDINDWFTDTMLNILERYRKNHWGYPINVSETDWDSIINQMIGHLRFMSSWDDHYDYQYESEEKYAKAYEKMNYHKEEFFKLFTKYFYDLWD